MPLPQRLGGSFPSRFFIPRIFRLAPLRTRFLNSQTPVLISLTRRNTSFLTRPPCLSKKRREEDGAPVISYGRPPEAVEPGNISA
jgi:hypothetical protein